MISLWIWDPKAMKPVQAEPNVFNGVLIQHVTAVRNEPGKVVVDSRSSGDGSTSSATYSWNGSELVKSRSGVTSPSPSSSRATSSTGSPSVPTGSGGATPQEAFLGLTRAVSAGNSTKACGFMYLRGHGPDGWVDGPGDRGKSGAYCRFAMPPTISAMSAGERAQMGTSTVTGASVHGDRATIDPSQGEPRVAFENSEGKVEPMQLIRLERRWYVFNEE